MCLAPFPLVPVGFENWGRLRDYVPGGVPIFCQSVFGTAETQMGGCFEWGALPGA